MQAHDKEPNNLPNQWVEGYMEAIRTAFSAITGALLICSIIYFFWNP